MRGIAKSSETNSRDCLTANTKHDMSDMKRRLSFGRGKCFCGSKSWTLARTSAQRSIGLIACGSLSASPEKMGGSNSIGVRTCLKTWRDCSTCNDDRIESPCKASRAAYGEYGFALSHTTTSSALYRREFATPLFPKFSMLKPKQEQLADSSYLVPITCYLYLPQNHNETSKYAVFGGVAWQ